MKFSREIYDEVHGFIDLTETEERLLHHCALARLSRIKQLGPAYHVYPSATHTRLSHSLGAMHLSDRLFVSAVGEDTYGRQLVRLAGLLHDVGHMPFSHALPGDHERFTREIISSMLGDEVAEYFPELLEILSGRHKYSPIIASEIDADRLDYLLRDAHHLGLPYRMVDLERLLRSARLVRVNGAWELVFKASAETAVEALLLTRLELFRRVYFHKHVSGFEALLARIYQEMPERSIVEPPKELIVSGRWCYFDDCTLIEIMKNLSRSGGWLAEASRMFLRGEFLHMVFEAPYASGVTLDELSDVVAKCPAPEEWVFLHTPKLVPMKDPSRVMLDLDGEVKRAAELQGSLLEKLAGYVYTAIRVYTRAEYAESLRGCLKKSLREL
ncbi:HD domain-containing protein [Infirmifilum sp. NZ]|uniref:HD domain-containing protein n=1 Tax=Infirmifilum sp. NZ TaxID=2926850 RepID=UPI0027A200C4|nr:HD domain-containing protein [Infirmifilum sp. NZ]UNQ72504.1 HD domain-containing protein [Infirmifilum sp. NZ]